MNIFKRFRAIRHRKRIHRFVDTLGRRAGLSIDAGEVEKLYRIDSSEMIRALKKKIEFTRHLFATICVTMTNQCWDRCLAPVADITVFTLLRAESGSRIIPTNVGKHTANSILAFRLLYRGFTWTQTHEDSKVEFNYDLFKELFIRLEKTRIDVTDQIWFVRHLNWLACTLNDIDERVTNWEVTVSHM